MEWKAFAAASYVDPIPRSLFCFENFVVLLLNFQEHVSWCPSPCAGDWKMLKDVFRLPQHNELAGCCWLCPATPITMKDCSTSAPWRVPFTTHDFISRLFHQGLACSPLFSLPAFSLQFFKLDWLHVMDLGVSADISGNVFWLLQTKLPGANVKARISELYKKLSKFYKENKVQDKLNTLTETMIRKKSTTPPKLTAGAAECRHLVPFLVFASEELLDPSKEMESTVLNVVRLLNQMYCLLDNYSQEAMSDAAKRLAILYTALFDMSEPPLWRLKPKIHLMLHLVQSLHSPTKTWTYRDEDYGGSAARSMRSRGGWDTAKVAGQTLLLKFCSRHELPRKFWTKSNISGRCLKAKHFQLVLQKKPLILKTFN